MKDKKEEMKGKEVKGEKMKKEQEMNKKWKKK